MTEYNWPHIFLWHGWPVWAEFVAQLCGELLQVFETKNRVAIDETQGSLPSLTNRYSFDLEIPRLHDASS